MPHFSARCSFPDWVRQARYAWDRVNLVTIRSRMRRVRSCLVASLCAASGLHAAPPAPFDIQPVLKNMERDGETYDPVPFHAKGLPALSALLDHLMPESAGVGYRDPALERDVATLIVELTDPNYAVRENATRNLTRYGRPAREELTLAAKSPDPEVRLRARTILESFCKPVPDRHYQLSVRYAAAYRRVVTGLEDRTSLQLLARRITSALIAGHDLDPFARPGATTLVDREDDEVVDLLIPLLESGDVGSSVGILNEVGAGRAKAYCPNFLIVALDHADPEIVHEAVTWVMPCPDQNKLAAIEALMRRRFRDPDPAIVLEIAGLRLRQSYDEAAVDILVGLAHASDRVNIATVLRRLAHPGACKPEQHQEILRRLAAKPIEHNEDGAHWLSYNIKKVQGEAALRLVLGCLGFGQENVLQSAVEHLENQNDRAMCRRVLAEIIRTHPKAETRAEAKEVLRSFEKRPE